MTSQIYADLAKVMRSVDHVGKGDFNSHQRFNFRGIDGVLNAVGPALREHNVVVYPRLHDVAYEEVKTSGGKASTACRVVVDYIFASVDGSTVETRVAAESWDTGDKAMPKAMSVAMRTALIQALSISSITVLGNSWSAGLNSIFWLDTPSGVNVTVRFGASLERSCTASRPRKYSNSSAGSSMG